jgi:nicotinamide mononucleotide transporter
MSMQITFPRRDQGVRVNLIQSVVIGVILTALSYIIGVNAGWIDSVNYLEAFAVFASYSATFLCVVERRANYPIGAVANAAYSLLFYQWGLYASAIVTGYLTFSLIYGWFRWKNDDDTKPVGWLDWKWAPAYIAATVLFYLGALAFATWAGGTLAKTDTVILVGSMLAQFLLDNKRIETWVVWGVVNVFAIYTYFNAGLPLAAFQYGIFLINVFYGFWMWKRAMDRNKVADLIPVGA